MAKTRVHEIATEYGVESKVVLEKLKEMGEFVKSASSTLDLPVVYQFQQLCGDELRGLPYTPPMPDGWYDEPVTRPAGRFERRQRPNPFSASYQDPKLREAAAVLGVPVHELRPANQPRRPGGRRPDATAKPLSSWERNLFDKAHAAAWQAAGLAPADGDLALRLAEKGLTPDDLSLGLRGMRAAARLRGGEPVHLVIREMVEVKAQKRAV